MLYDARNRNAMASGTRGLRPTVMPLLLPASMTFPPCLFFYDFRTSSEQPIHYINPISKKSILLEASMLIFTPKGLGADARGARDGTPSAVRVRFLSESSGRVRRREIL